MHGKTGDQDWGDGGDRRVMAGHDRALMAVSVTD